MPKTYTADEIARYFLAKTDASVGDLISNLKLQKLCYYAQGIGLAVRGAPMFREPMEAWLHGPVVPTLYRQYKERGSNAIDPVENLDLSAYATEDRMILDDVYSHFGQYSAWRLREMTHTESPWRDNYDDQFGGSTIPHDKLKSFFSEQISGEYRQKYEQVSEGSRQAIPF